MFVCQSLSLGFLREFIQSFLTAWNLVGGVEAFHEFFLATFASNYPPNHDPFQSRASASNSSSRNWAGGALWMFVGIDARLGYGKLGTSPRSVMLGGGLRLGNGAMLVESG